MGEKKVAGEQLLEICLPAGDDRVWLQLGHCALTLSDLVASRSCQARLKSRMLTGYGRNDKLNAGKQRLSTTYSVQQITPATSG